MWIYLSRVQGKHVFEVLCRNLNCIYVDCNGHDCQAVLISGHYVCLKQTETDENLEKIHRMVTKT